LENEKRKNRIYPAEFKIKVAEAYLSGKEGGHIAVGRKFGLSRRRVEDWVRTYKEKGIDGFLHPTRGRKFSVRPKPIELEDMTLEEQVKYLKMENDILKKVKALLKN